MFKKVIPNQLGIFIYFDRNENVLLWEYINLSFIYVIKCSDTRVQRINARVNSSPGAFVSR